MPRGTTERPPDARAEWAYFLDLDGTLVEIAETPEAIRVDAALLQLLAGLHGAVGGAVAVVSGRSLDDLDARFAGLGLGLVGQHGLEWRDGGGRAHRPVAAPDATEGLRRWLAPRIATHPGLLLEDKGQTLALHYRRAPRLAAYVHRLMRELLAAAGPRWCLQTGKRVLEIRPAGVDKGRAVELFLSAPPFVGRAPVFVGDDLTDEQGFAAADRRGGLSIKVGAGPTQARWRLPDVGAVRSWLADVARTGHGRAQ